jgi:SAM-dependent methyltransferase
MYGDVIDLREFYGSSLGRAARRVVRGRIREVWPDLHGMRLLGLGYATPFLLPFREECERVLAVMPAGQGVVHWPADGPGLAALADESELPLPDVSIDRVLLVHALERAEQLRPMLREVWRVMADGGRLLAVVPNRRGIWARLDRTPFGQGRPYTASQLSQLLRENMFDPIRTRHALFVPPSRSRMLIAAAPAWEKLGARWLPTFCGVVMIEAGKQIYAASAVQKASRRRAYAALPPATPAPTGGSARAAPSSPNSRASNS